MRARGTALDEHRVEQAIGLLLRTGVLLAAAVVCAGAALYLIRHGGERIDYRVFRGERADLRSVRGILAGALALQGRDVIQLGLLVLLATPVARVVFSVGAFALQRDWLYVGVTLAVLTVLLWSLAGGAL
jgi:uncharacterized membrane protein